MLIVTKRVFHFKPSNPRPQKDVPMSQNGIMGHQTFIREKSSIFWLLFPSLASYRKVVVKFFHNLDACAFWKKHQS